MEYKKAMVGAMKINNTTLSTTIPGMIGHRTGPLSDEALQQKQNYEQFVWLIKG